MQTIIGASMFAILCTVVASSVSTAISHWISQKQVHSGLWNACDKAQSGVSVCSALPDVHDWMKAVRALMILGTILFGMSLLLACIFARDLSIHSKKGCFFCLMSGGILLITAVMVFAGNADVDSARSFDSALYLAIAAAIVAIFTASAVYEAKSRPRDGYSEIHA